MPLKPNPTHGKTEPFGEPLKTTPPPGTRVEELLRGITPPVPVPDCLTQAVGLSGVIAPPSRPPEMLTRSREAFLAKTAPPPGRPATLLHRHEEPPIPKASAPSQAQREPKRSNAEVNTTEKVQTAYRQLSQAALDLNAASDELVKPIKTWESALKKLNLGVPAWVDSSSGGEDPDWWDRGVGYTRLKDGWGIALRTRSGSDRYPDHDSEELWAFNDAPRWLRIEGVGKLPDLLGALLRQAEDTTRKLKAKVTQANELAEAITAAADELAALERK